MRLNNKMNIERIKKIIKKKNQKTSKIIKFLYQSYQNDNTDIFYRFNKRWFDFFKENYRQSLSFFLFSKSTTI